MVTQVNRCHFHPLCFERKVEHQPRYQHPSVFDLRLRSRVRKRYVGNWTQGRTLRVTHHGKTRSRIKPVKKKKNSELPNKESIKLFNHYSNKNTK